MIGRLFLLLAVFLAIAAVQIARRIHISPRAVGGFREIPRQVGRALETGQPIHFALGSGGLVGGEAGLTLSGARTLARLADDTAAGEVPPFVTVADPMALLYARHLLYEAYRRQQIPSAVPPDRVGWMGASPMAYAAGLTLFLGTQPVGASALSGLLREEAVLIGEIGQRYGAASIFAMPEPAGAAVLWPLDPALAAGEEAFGAPAPEERPGGPSALLLTHDLFRWVLIAVLVAAALGLVAWG